MIAPSFQPGMALDGGNYLLGRFLACGAMGEVYEATSSSTGERVAVKILTADKLREQAHDNEWYERFQLEAKLAGAIRSPYVARALRAGRSRSADCAWIAFELLQGESLFSRLRRQIEVPLHDVAWLVDHILCGLEAAHGAKVIHRDLKPSNLFFDRTRNLLCILDFGLAKVDRDGAQTSGLTRLGAALGTPSYASPEQLRSARDVDKRSDIYSAGTVAFELLTGRLPFAQDELAAMLNAKHLRAAPTLADTTGARWHEDAEQWMRTALAADRAARFADAGAARAAWARVVDLIGQGHAVTAGAITNVDTDVAPPKW